MPDLKRHYSTAEDRGVFKVSTTATYSSVFVDNLHKLQRQISLQKTSRHHSVLFEILGLICITNI